MFFGNSRISFIKNLASLIQEEASNNNYVVVFIDEATTDYVGLGGDSVGFYWENDRENFLVSMEGRNQNSFVVFDIETALSPGADYIWPSNVSGQSLPFPSENVVEIFRPSPFSQQQFYDTFLENLEARWGTGIWEHLSSTGNKLLIVVDVSGSMNLALIQEALNYFTSYLSERNVEHYILDGCANERWLAWSSAAFIDGPSAGCTSACNWGINCKYACENGATECFVSICIPPYKWENGGVVPNSCEESCEDQEVGNPPSGVFVKDIICSTYNIPGGEIGGACITPCVLVQSGTADCECPRYGGNCNVCGGPTGEDHKCVQCYYYEENFWNPNDPVPDPFPSIDPTLTLCQMTPCSLTQGTYLGEAITSNSPFDGDSRYIGWTGGTGNFWSCTGSNFSQYVDDFGNCMPCPLLHPDTSTPLAKIVICGFDENGGFTGCTGCGLTYGFDIYFDVCGLTC